MCNPPLRALITETLGSDAWVTNLDMLQSLREKADDPDFQRQWREVKAKAKAAAMAKISALTGVQLPANSMLDVQVKRIHEYKRQFMNVLGVIHRYHTIKQMDASERAKVVPRSVVIGGKAAPGYEMAKRIIKLVSAVGDTINRDPEVADLLKVVFLPDYNVSLAEIIIPGTELSQHISTAGTEASGTSNMKFTMNGSLIIGTLDGANIEIGEEIGFDNMFIFGAKTEDVPQLRAQRPDLQVDPRFENAVNMIRQGVFGWEGYFEELLQTLSGQRDYYLLADDFPAYLEAQEKVDEAYADQQRWTHMSIMSTAGSGYFSSDRTIQQYAEEIWGAKPCSVPANM
jgi:starch phosphorylase